MANILGAIDAVVTQVMGALRFHINDYCEIATTEGTHNLISIDGSVASIIEYDGFMTLVGEDEYTDYLRQIETSLAPYMIKRAHSMQVVFVSDGLSEEMIRNIQAPSYDTARRLRMTGMGEILDDTRNVLASTTSAERCFIVLWTSKAALDPVEAQIERDRIRQVAKGKIPPLKEAQNPFITSRQLVDMHNAFAQTILTRLQQTGALCRMLDVHTIIGFQKKFLYRDKTPSNWRPILPGDKYWTRWKKTDSGDYSVFLPPPISSQVMMGEAEVGSKTSEIGFTDSRAAKIGDTAYAPVYVNIMPLEPRYFNDLFGPLNRVYTSDSKGNSRKMPYAISFHITGDGISAAGLKKVFAGVLGIASQANRDLVSAYNTLSAYSKTGGCVVKYQISAVTWAGVKESEELAIRRSRLLAAIAGWGNATVTDETGDPLLGLMSTVPAMSPFSDAPATAAPLIDVLTMMPLARPASVFEGGHCPYRTLDGKVMRWQMFSSHQSAWITLIWAIMGSGKSVWLNRNNIEMCMMPGLKQLPYICAVDIGVSSKGFIDLIKYTLPKDQRHLAIYERIQNTSDYAVNQMDTKLGCRLPLPHERAYIISFLLELVTPAGRSPHKFMADLLARLVDTIYDKLSDKTEGGTPKEYAHNSDERVTEAVNSLGIQYSGHTTWWDIVDELALVHGRYVEAEIAQRYASPTITDLQALTSEPDIQAEFKSAMDDSVGVIEEFTIRASSAISNYKVFNGTTRFDVGSSRVMAIDLQDVVTTGSAEAKKGASLFFAMARTCFIRKINLSEDDLKLVNPQYRMYYERIFKSNQETPKRISYDEYHKTGGSPNLRNIIDTDGREGRKWFLEIMLASQKPDDFGEMAEIATVKVILNAGTAGAQEKIRSIYGLSRTEELALKEHVHGPSSRGATFLAKVTTKSGEKTQLYTSQMGPITMWALTTTAEDRALRSELYKVMPDPILALNMLRIHYPDGSCKAAVDALKADPEALKRAMGDSDADEDNPFAAVMAQKVYQDYMRRRANGEFADLI